MLISWIVVFIQYAMIVYIEGVDDNIGCILHSVYSGVRYSYNSPWKKVELYYIRTSTSGNKKKNRVMGKKNIIMDLKKNKVMGKKEVMGKIKVMGRKR